MLKKLLASILEPYSQALFDKRENVKLLFYFNLVTSVLFSLIIILINTLNNFQIPV